MAVLAYSPLLHGLLTGKFRRPEDVPPGRARTRHFSAERPLVRHGEPGCEQETFATISRIREICERRGLDMAHVAIAWVIAQAGVAAAIVGARRPAQAAANARSAELRLDPELLDELSSATDQLKEILGPNPDMWQSDSRFH